MSNYSTQFSDILTSDALLFLEKLHQEFNATRIDLLKKRTERQLQIDNGVLPDFLNDTEQIRKENWKAFPIPKQLKDRRVEITGPVDAKMIINALNSGANVFMADFEDANSPTFSNSMIGQRNLKDANRGKLAFESNEGKKYTLKEEGLATLMVRPRGWHLEEIHLKFNGENASGSLVDFGLYFFHNAKYMIENGKIPAFYLPKLESHIEARLWNEVFIFSQNYMKIPQGTIKATVLIETILATFELHEIIYELKEHIAGLNCGRWDYIFSYIKKLKNFPNFILPDRGQVTMDTPFLDAYSRYVIQTCHKRGIHAMGGMSAFIPIRGDEAANNTVFEKVRADKLREVKNGHDGTWVAHPGLIAVAKEIFDQYMPNANQYSELRIEDIFEASDFLTPPKGTKTENGVRQNIQVGILYIESWLRGIGAAAIHHLMEDAATAEISRIQVWQYLKYKVTLENGKQVSVDLIENWIVEELEKIKEMYGNTWYDNSKIEAASKIFRDLVFSNDCEEFLTISAYKILTNSNN